MTSGHDDAYPRRRRACWLASLGLTLAGCSFAPEYVRPPLPVPGEYAANAVPGESVARIGWRDFFPDPHLQALIEAALDHNRDIRIASARVLEARAAWRIEGASLYPELDATVTRTNARNLFNLPGADPQPVEQRQTAAQLNASWEIDFWGRVRNLREAARQQYLATEESRRAVATSLVAQVANGYLLAREYEERAELARRSIETREEALRIARRRYEVGSRSRLDMMQAQTLLAQAETALQALEMDREVNRNALALLVGRPVEVVTARRRLAGSWPTMTLPVGLPSDLLLNRPDIAAAEHQLMAAHANIGAARAAFFPNIRLTGAYGLASESLDGLFENGVRVWSFTPTISVPLFNAGRLRASVDLQEARRVRGVAEYEQIVQTAFRDVSDALVRRRQIALQIESTVRLLEAQRERARLAQLLFDNGRSAYLEVLDAQRDLFDAEQSLVQLRRAELASVVALYSALGGGFSATPDMQIPPQQGGGPQR